MGDVVSFVANLAKFGILPVRRPQPRWRFVCTRGAFPFNIEGAGANNYTRFECQITTRTGSKNVGLARLIYAYGRSDTSAVSERFDDFNAAQLESAIVVSSLMRPMTFGGVLNPTLGLGAGLVLSDQISLDVAAGSSVQLRSALICASTEKVAVSHLSALSSTYKAFDSTSGSSQVYQTADMVVGAGAVATYGVTPVGVIGQTDAPENSFLLWGDSIMHGLGEATGAGDSTYGHLGWAERGLLNVNGNFVPFCNASRTGDMTRGYGTYSYRRRALFQFATDVVFGMGNNDIAGGVSLATMQANCTAIWAAARRAGCRVHQANLTPRTTSTSTNWTSAADQTVVSGYETAGIRGQFNAWLLTKVADGTISGVIDINAIAADPASPDKWVSNGTNDYATADGIHPSPAMYALMAVAMNTYAAALPVRHAYA